MMYDLTNNFPSKAIIRVRVQPWRIFSFSVGLLVDTSRICLSFLGFGAFLAIFFVFLVGLVGWG